MRLEPWYFKQALVNASAGIGDINGAIQTGRQENTTKKGGGTREREGEGGPAARPP